MTPKKKTAAQIREERYAEMRCRFGSLERLITRLTSRVNHFSRRAYALRDLIQRISKLEKNIDSNGGRVAALELTVDRELPHRLERLEKRPYFSKGVIAEEICREIDRRRKKRHDSWYEGFSILVVIVVAVLAITGAVTVIAELAEALG